MSGSVLDFVLLFAKCTSAYCIEVVDETLNFTSFIFRFKSSCGLAEVSLAVVLP
jgi:hypothetical protein